MPTRFSVVADDAQALEVVGGTEGVLSSLLPGAIVAIHTTVSLETIHRLAAQADARGMVVLDAGISGGEAGSAAGTLLTMVGGPVHAVDTARPILGCFSKEVLHAGPVGAGMALKLARNATGYAMMVAVHEAMELAHRSGVDLALLRHTISETGVCAAPFTTRYASNGLRPAGAHHVRIGAPSRYAMRSSTIWA